MRKRRAGIVLIAAAAALGITACGSSVPEMSEEQNAQVVEYAAGLLLKYDENYDGRLIEEEAPEETAEKEDTKPENENQEPVDTAEASAQSPSEGSQGNQEDPIVVDRSGENQEGATVVDRTGETAEYGSIEEFYGIDGVTITYTGYELKDRYPDVAAEDMYFAMNAASGRKLLVLHFDVANVSGQDLNLDMLSLGTKFKISINEEAPRYALTTMLTDDLASFTGTVAADSSVSLVLVGEIPEENSDSVQTLSLMMKNVSEDATISLN